MSQFFSQSRIPAAFRMTTLGFATAFGVALPGYLSTPTTSVASPINYVITSASAPPDDVTGSFTFNASDGATGTESNVMITVTGTEFAGTYTQLAATAAFATNIITAYDSTTAVTVQISFEDALDVNPDPLAPEGIMGFTGEFPPTSYDFTSGDAAIAATTPLPPALPLFAAGLGAVALFGWRRKRKAAAVVAAWSSV
jgi:hypothetical protein